MNSNFLPSGHFLSQRYSIQSSIGQGGFGITYIAYDQKLDQEVCIKELFVTGNSTRGANLTVNSQSISDFSFEDFVKKFVQEARQLARFQHPNIVGVIDVFEEHQTAYMVMEYVKGETLKEKIQRDGFMNELPAMLLTTQLLDAVSEIHKKGVLHRDIKPDNILITSENRVVLIDFGSAREFAEGKSTSTKAIFTPSYAPPEQYSEKAKRGPSTDIYALGATLYFVLTGEKPITATDRTFENLIPPHQINPKVSSQLSSIVMVAMEMKQEDRFQTVLEMKEAIDLIQTSLKPVQEEKKVFETKNQTNLGNENKEKYPSSKKFPTKLLLFIFVITLLSGFSAWYFSTVHGIKDSLPIEAKVYSNVRNRNKVVIGSLNLELSNLKFTDCLKEVFGDRIIKFSSYSSKEILIKDLQDQKTDIVILNKQEIEQFTGIIEISEAVFLEGFSEDIYIAMPINNQIHLQNLTECCKK